jgi:hypothetical protein
MKLNLLFYVFLLLLCIQYCDSRFFVSRVKEIKLNSLRSFKVVANAAFGNGSSAFAFPYLSESSSLLSRESFKLVTDIIFEVCPHGILPLSYYFAQSQPLELVPAVSVIFLVAVINAFSFVQYAHLGRITGSSHISDIWQKLVSSKTSWIVDAAQLLLCSCYCLNFSSLLCEIFHSLAVSNGFKGLFLKKEAILAFLHGIILLPFCLEEKFQHFTFPSVFGTFSVMYTLGLLIWKSASKSSLRFPPLFWSSPAKSQLGQSILDFLPTISLSFVSHYCSLQFYRSFPNSSSPSAFYSFRKSSLISYTVVAMIFSLAMSSGFLLFGLSSSPFIHDNFSLSDPFLVIARLLLGVTVLFAYPLMFENVKLSCFRLVERFADTEKSKLYLKPITAVVLFSVLSCTTLVLIGSDSPALRFVESVTGVFIAYLLPAVLTLLYLYSRNQAGFDCERSDIIVSASSLTIASFVLFRKFSGNLSKSP